MKLTADGQDSSKTTLDDDASIYSKREKISEREKFKNLSGKAKWQYFKDYILFKLVFGIAIAAVVISLLYTTLRPRPVDVANIAVINDPFGNTTWENIKAQLSDRLITDAGKQQITIDTGYLFAGNDYNERLKFVTVSAAAQIDFVVLPESEFVSYMESNAFLKLSEIFSDDELVKYKDFIVDYKGNAYGLDLTTYIHDEVGFDTSARYLLVCMVNSKNKENYKELASILCKVK